MYKVIFKFGRDTDLNQEWDCSIQMDGPNFSVGEHVSLPSQAIKRARISDIEHRLDCFGAPFHVVGPKQYEITVFLSDVVMNSDRS